MRARTHESIETARKTLKTKNDVRGLDHQIGNTLWQRRMAGPVGQGRPTVRGKRVECENETGVLGANMRTFLYSQLP